SGSRRIVGILELPRLERAALACETEARITTSGQSDGVALGSGRWQRRRIRRVEGLHASLVVAVERGHRAVRSETEVVASWVGEPSPPIAGASACPPRAGAPSRPASGGLRTRRARRQESEATPRARVRMRARPPAPSREAPSAAPR